MPDSARDDNSARALSEGVVRRLHEAGYTAYFAGGCVRDMIMGLPSDDYDVATDARPEDVTALFLRTIEVGAQFGVVIVMENDHQIEVATFRSDDAYIDGRHPEAVTFSSPEQDAQRRDFTINGLFYDPVADKLLDFVGGRKDIEAKIVRAIGDPVARFKEDHLRLLRAVRFAARFDFHIEEQTLRAIKELAPLITRVSAERICAELEKMLLDSSRAEAMCLLDSTGLLEQILPEVSRMKGVEQPTNYHPEGDVFTHAVLSLEFLQKPDFITALATLLHDIGKSEAAVKHDGKITFYRHEILGEKIARDICERLKMSRTDTEAVAWLVRKHMIFKDVRNMRESRLKRLFASEAYSSLEELCRADALASTNDVSDCEYCHMRREQMTEEEIKPSPLLNGKDLIEMGLKPGPIFSRLLDGVYEEQLEGNLRTKEDAMEYVKKLLRESGE
jgi:poly(A) polymerase